MGVRASRSTEMLGAARSDRLAARLAEIHANLRAGGRVSVRLSGDRTDGLLELVVNAGFESVRIRRAADGVRVTARRAFTLPDWIRPRLDVLFCGLNPSIYATEGRMPFGRPGNRFWPAALAARIVPLNRDLRAALTAGVGFTDLVKRPTRRASELRAAEYDAGVARIARLVHSFRPAVLCFVGLEGWRRAVDRTASPGWIPVGFEGSQAYLMPSTSGLNAHASLDDLVAHLRRVRRRAQGKRDHRPPSILPQHRE